MDLAPPSFPPAVLRIAEALMTAAETPPDGPLPPGRPPLLVPPGVPVR